MIRGRGVRKRYGMDVRDEVVRMHVGDEMSMRSVAARLRRRCGCEMGVATVARMLQEAGSKCKDSVDIARELAPRWSGWLMADAKAVKIEGEDYAVLLAKDRTGDVVDGVLAWGEDKESWRAFFLELRDAIGYKLRGLTSDMGDDLIWAVREVYGEVPHQYCVFHMLRVVDERVGYKSFRQVLRRYGRVYVALRHRILTLRFKGLATMQLESCKRREAQRIRGWVRDHRLELEVRGWARRFLLASSKNEAVHYMAQLVLLKRRCRRRSKLTGAIETLVEKRDALLIHHDYPGLSRTNNEAEELIRQFQRHLKTMDGFGSEEGARGFLKLWMLRYRFKSHECCRGRNSWKNGKSPLELAGINTAGLDWVRFSRS